MSTGGAGLGAGPAHSQIGGVRAIVVSRAYADPAARGKLKALAGLGVTVAAAVPERWMPAGVAHEEQTTFGDDGGIRTVPIPIRGSSAPSGDPLWHAGTLRKLLSEYRPDIVQIEEEPSTRVASTFARAARRLHLPYVILVRQSLPINHGVLPRLRRHRTLSGAIGIIGVNEAAVRLGLRDHPALPHRTAPQMGVPLPLNTQRSSHVGLAIGFVGRLIPEKGLDLLFRACVKLVGRWSITVVGTGPAQEELEGLAERLGIAGRVTWLGALPRGSVDDVWSRLDCLVMPSRTTPRWVEVTPRAALHAMAHGVAVLGSSAGALPETLGEAGVIVPEEDVPALAAALQRLHDTPGESARLGAAGRRRVMDEYTDAAVADKTLRFWREVLRATA